MNFQTKITNLTAGGIDHHATNHPMVVIKKIPFYVIKNKQNEHESTTPNCFIVIVFLCMVKKMVENVAFAMLSCFSYRRLWFVRVLHLYNVSIKKRAFSVCVCICEHKECYRQSESFGIRFTWTTKMKVKTNQLVHIWVACMPHRCG